MAQATAQKVEKHYSIAGVQELLGGASRTYVKDLIRTRQLTFLKLGPGRRAKVLIAESSIADFLARTARKMPSAADVAESQA